MAAQVDLINFYGHFKAVRSRVESTDTRCAGNFVKAPNNPSMCRKPPCIGKESGSRENKVAIERQFRVLEPDQDVWSLTHTFVTIGFPIQCVFLKLNAKPLI